MGVRRDLVQVYKWRKIGASRLDEGDYPPEVISQSTSDALKSLDALESRMSQRQLAKAQRLAAEWQGCNG